jgi:hypothetical protein
MGALRRTLIAHGLWAPLAVLARLAAAPGRADGPPLRRACRELVAWLEANGAWTTALAFEAEMAAAWPRAGTPG